MGLKHFATDGAATLLQAVFRFRSFLHNFPFAGNLTLLPVESDFYCQFGCLPKKKGDFFQKNGYDIRRNFAHRANI